MVNFAYLRVSTDRQDVDNQKFGILDYCNRQKITHVEMIEDRASGKKTGKIERLEIYSLKLVKMM